MTMNELNRLIGRTMRAAQVAPESRKADLAAACRYLNKARRALTRGYSDEVARGWLSCARLAVIHARLV